MAKDREPEKSQLESSEEEEDDDDGSSEEIESEPEPKSQPQIPSKPQPPSSSEEESDSDSDSDADSDVPVAAQKPRASEPVMPSRSTAKRPAEKKEPDTKELKKPKKAEPGTYTKLGGGTTSDSSKKVLFQRVWSEGDEITILQGMIDYAEKKKMSPLVDLDAFLEFIRKNLQCDVNKGQLQDKIKRLKKKYENIKSNKRNLTKRHEQEAYALSTKIWGDEKGREVTIATPGGANEGAVKKTPSKKRSTVENGQGDCNVVDSEEVANGGLDKLLVANVMSSYGFSAGERVLRMGAQLFEGANNGVEGAKEWRRLMIEDMEANLKQLDVVREQTRLVLDVLKSANQ